jgi:hypothetical protein
MTEKSYLRMEASEPLESRYYIIFNEVENATAEDRCIAQQLAEIQELEEISKVILDCSSEEPPRFKTST